MSYLYEFTSNTSETSYKFVGLLKSSLVILAIALFVFVSLFL